MNEDQLRKEFQKRFPYHAYSTKSMPIGTIRTLLVICALAEMNQLYWNKQDEKTEILLNAIQILFARGEIIAIQVPSELKQNEIEEALNKLLLIDSPSKQGIFFLDDKWYYGGIYNTGSYNATMTNIFFESIQRKVTESVQNYIFDLISKNKKQEGGTIERVVLNSRVTHIPQTSKSDFSPIVMHIDPDNNAMYYVLRPLTNNSQFKDVEEKIFRMTEEILSKFDISYKPT